MATLYFPDFISTLTTVLLLLALAFATLVILRRAGISNWGRLPALFILAGTAISAISAARDAYATPRALFAMDSAQSLLCSIVGIAIFLIGIASVFFKKSRPRGGVSSMRSLRYSSFRSPWSRDQEPFSCWEV